MEHSINLNDEKTAKLVFYKEKDKLRIDVMNYENVGSDESILLYAIYLELDEIKKLEHLLYDVSNEIKNENKE